MNINVDIDMNANYECEKVRVSVNTWSIFLLGRMIENFGEVKNCSRLWAGINLMLITTLERGGLYICKSTVQLWAFSLRSMGVTIHTKNTLTFMLIFMLYLYKNTNIEENEIIVLLWGV